MRSNRTRLLVATLAAAALAAPAAQATDYHQPFGPSGGHSSGGPAYGIPTAQAPGDRIHKDMITLRRDGSQAMPFALEPNPAQATSADGFDWQDAGIGAGTGIAAVLLAAAGARARGYKLAHS